MRLEEATIASASVVRAHIARVMLRDVDVPSTIGSITLHPHQIAAASRLISAIERHGGALLADPVGLGKTYTSLAVATSLSQPITLVVPSSLRAAWRDALQRCALAATIITHEALSRAAAGPVDPVDGLVIVDEAHRARSVNTRRYAALATLCKRARTLLLTATPVQNRRADLAAQLALFLGHSAWTMHDQELAEHVVRGGAAQPPDLPALDGPQRVELDANDDCLEQILALAPPVPAADESLAAALVTYGLLHQWSSSRAALRAALTRRRARALAMLAALDAGRRPTRTELSAWTYADDALQLAFPELVGPNGGGDAPGDDLAALTIAIDRHHAGVEALLHSLRTGPDPDDARALALRRIRARHPGERIIAFCQYMETVNMLRAKLAREPGVAALTARGARVAGGRLPRDAVLAQFTPRATPTKVSPAERIDLLVTTDLLSEGLDLQEASVVVHLDLPWNPARLDQRVGRIRRLGSRYSSISVYAFAPPAPAERVLRIEQRLREKLCIAQRAVGVAGRILPLSIMPDAAPAGLAESRGELQAKLRVWRSAAMVDDETAAGSGLLVDHPPPEPPRPLTASVASPTRGWLAVVHDQSDPELVADIGHGVTTAPDDLLAAIELAERPDVPLNASHASHALHQLDRWLDTRRGTQMIDLRAAASARHRRLTLARVSRALERTPRHRRALIAPLADAARTVATARLAEGAERVLEMLAGADLPDEAWLRSIATFATLNARPSPRASRSSGAATPSFPSIASSADAAPRLGLLALLLFRSEPP